MIFRTIKIQKRALLLSALFLFFSSNSILAEPLTLTALQAKATDLLLKKERLRAAKEVRRALDQASEGQKSQYQKILDHIAGYFLTNEAQRLFEKSKVQMRAESEHSFLLLKQALELEPWNYTLNSYRVEKAIFHSQCKLILPSLSKILAVYPKYLQKENILLAFSICTQDTESLERQLAAKKEPVPSPIFFLWLKFKQGEKKMVCEKAKNEIAQEALEAPVLIYSLAWQSCDEPNNNWAQIIVQRCEKETSKKAKYLPTPCGDQKLLEQLKKTIDSSSI